MDQDEYRTSNQGLRDDLSTPCCLTKSSPNINLSGGAGEAAGCDEEVLIKWSEQ